MEVSIFYDMGPRYVGGAETYIKNLGIQLIKKGIKVNWFSIKEDEKSYENYKGINCYKCWIPFKEKYLWSRKFFALTMFSKFLKAKNSNLLQFNGFIAGLSGWLLGKLLRKPYLLNVFELFQDIWTKMGNNFLEKKFYPIIERIIVKSPYPFFITISNYTKFILKKIGVEERLIKVIYLAADEIFNPNYPKILKEKFKDKKIIGWAGRMVLAHSKNLIELLEAFKIVKNEVKNSILVFDGIGFEEILPKIKSLNLKLNKDVFYNGCSKREDLPKFYVSCDVYALSSLSEGFGLAALEAQACGVPVVCYSSGALKEVVKNKRTGILVENKDPESLAESIIKVLLDESLREKLSKNAVEWAKSFSWEKCAEEHLKVYNKLIENWKY